MAHLRDSIAAGTDNPLKNKRKKWQTLLNDATFKGWKIKLATQANCMETRSNLTIVKKFTLLLRGPEKTRVSNEEFTHAIKEIGAWERWHAV
jgi:hypothetical protein